MLLYYDLIHDDILGRDTPKLSWRKGPLDDDISNVFTWIKLFVLQPWKILSFRCFNLHRGILGGKAAMVDTVSSKVAEVPPKWHNSIEIP
ncbi:hypothetical protein AMTRI_Chr05g58810 [Amborella trichopoda]